MDWEDFEMEMIDGGAEDIDSDEEEVMITQHLKILVLCLIN